MSGKHKWANPRRETGMDRSCREKDSARCSNENTVQGATESGRKLQNNLHETEKLCEIKFDARNEI